jgi:hypothetical protein
MDDILIWFCVAFLIGYILAKGFKEGINKFYSKLGFVVGRAMVGLDVSLKALNKVGYLFKGFSNHADPPNWTRKGWAEELKRFLSLRLFPFLKYFFAKRSPLNR